jgi:hypothetical protein
MGVRQRLCREWALLALLKVQRQYARKRFTLRSYATAALLLTFAQGWLPPVRGDDAGRHMHALRGDVRSIVTPKQQKTLPVGMVHTNVSSLAISTARSSPR